MSSTTTKSDETALWRESHKSHRTAWLRAAVLGADDGIVSTASLMLGVAAAQSPRSVVLTAGLAGLIAGALSMAAGEYVSVGSQRDSENADLEIEARELESFADEELDELTHIYRGRGLKPELAREVAVALHENNALAAHARDELGINHEALSNPTLAAVSSALSFAAGGTMPILAAFMLTGAAASWAIVIVALVALCSLGALGAFIGGGVKKRAAMRVFVGGGLAMLITYIIGHFIGIAV